MEGRVGADFDAVGGEPQCGPRAVDSAEHLGVRDVEFAEPVVRGLLDRVPFLRLGR